MNKRTDIITSAMDIMAGFDLLTSSEQKEVLQTLIDSLGSYPKPQQKGSTKEPTAETLGVYLFVSNARNTARLHLLGYIDDEMTAIYIHRHFMNTLTLLVEV